MDGRITSFACEPPRRLSQGRCSGNGRAETELGASGPRVEGKPAVIKPFPKANRTCAAGERGEGSGKADPEMLDCFLRRGEIDEHESTLRTKHTAHFPEGGANPVLRKDVKEIAGKDRVESVIRVGEGCGLPLTQAEARMGNGGHSLPSAAEHGGGAVYALRPAGEVGGGNSVQGEPGAGAHVQDLFAVLYLKPRPTCGARSVGDGRNESIVDAGEAGVRRPQGVGCS